MIGQEEQTGLVVPVTVDRDQATTQDEAQLLLCLEHETNR